MLLKDHYTQPIECLVGGIYMKYHCCHCRGDHPTRPPYVQYGLMSRYRSRGLSFEVSLTVIPALVSLSVFTLRIHVLESARS